jgi:hypothetical protein
MSSTLVRKIEIALVGKTIMVDDVAEEQHLIRYGQATETQ